MIEFSFHLLERAPQRGFKPTDVEFIVKNTKPRYNAGVRFHRLKRKDLPKSLAPNDRRRNLVGAVVVVSSCGCTGITVYHTYNDFSKDLKKEKYNLRPGLCSYCREQSAA